MSYTASYGGPGVGIFPGNEDVVVWNRTGATLALGSVVMFDLTGSDGDVSNGTVGNDNSILANVIAPLVAVMEWGFFGVVVDTLVGAGANDTKVKIRLRGFCEALMIGSDAAALGDNCVIVNAQVHLTSDGSPTSKILGKALETTAGTGEELCNIWFDGIQGFGYDHA